MWSLQAEMRVSHEQLHKEGIASIEPILPKAYRIELEIYGRENQFIQAIAIKY